MFSYAFGPEAILDGFELVLGGLGGAWGGLEGVL